MENAVKSFSTAAFALTILLVCQTTLADIYESVNDPKAKSFGNRVCTNKECTMIAANLLNYRNEKVDSCNDFANYVCGNYELFVTKNDPMVNMHMQMSKKLVQLLKTPMLPEDKPYHKLAKASFNECLNAGAIRETMKSNILALLDEIGGWPLLNPQWKKFDGSWEEYIAGINRKYNAPILFKSHIQENLKPGNDGNKILVLELSPALRFREPELIDAATALGADTSSLSQDVTQIFKLERERLMLTSGTSYHKLSEFMKALPNFDIAKYVRRLFDGIAEVTPDTIIGVSDIPFFLNISKFTTDKRVLANYVASALVLSRIDILNRAVKGEAHCVGLTTMLFDYPLTQMYLKEHFNYDDVVPKVLEMTKLMAEVLKESIKQASWLDEETRSAAFKKLAHLKVYIAYPENVLNDTYISEVYNTRPYESSEGFIAFCSRIERLLRVAQLSEVGKPSDQKIWPADLRVLQANAFYRSFANKAFIHIGVLETPFFTQNVPAYVNFAAIGQVLAHEFMHGFDNNGRGYNEHGQILDWWSAETTKKFEEKATCYVKQYSKEGINGVASLGENIADNVGMKIAYEAYKKLIASPEPALPGFEEFTLDQMFFLIYASSWCDVSNPADANPNGIHPANAIRIKGVAQNMKEFGKAFNCPNMSKMNPTQKCSIW